MVDANQTQQVNLPVHLSKSGTTENDGSLNQLPRRPSNHRCQLRKSANQESLDEEDLSPKKNVRSFSPQWVLEFWSEFFGTFMILVFGDGSIAQVVLTDGQKGDYQTVFWGWGIGVMLGIYVSQPSGSHLNPAVTIISCLFRGFAWKKIPHYIIAQILGAFAGAAVIYLNYKSAITLHETGPRIRTYPNGPDSKENHTTGEIFCSYPASNMTPADRFFNEFIPSVVLMILIFALNDHSKSNEIIRNLTPLMFFFIVFGLGASFGWETGYAGNFARDFGPRVLSYLVGYGNVFEAGTYFFWIPLVAPLTGCFLGALIYDLFIYRGKDSPIVRLWGGLFAAGRKSGGVVHSSV